MTLASVLTGIGFFLVLCVFGYVRFAVTQPRYTAVGMGVLSAMVSSPAFIAFAIAAFVTGCLWSLVFRGTLGM